MAALWKVLWLRSEPSPWGLRARIGSSPSGTGIGGWENAREQGAFWIGLWKPERFQAEPQRSFTPVPRAQMPFLLCPHWSCRHASCPHRELMLTGHQPLCSTAVLHMSWLQGPSLSCRPYPYVPCVWVQCLAVGGTSPTPVPLPRSLF